HQAGGGDAHRRRRRRGRDRRRVAARFRGRVAGAGRACGRILFCGGRSVMDAGQGIIRPVVSEKTFVLAEDSKYTFRVHERAHETKTREASEQLSDDRVVEVRTVFEKSKPRRRGHTYGRTRQWKKAIVQVRPGQTIPIFQGLEATE